MKANTLLWTSHLGTQAGMATVVATTPTLQRMLESAVIANWADVLPAIPGGQVDLEYRIAADGSLEFLRLWACSRKGFCSLICQYSMFWKWSSTQEVSFGSGFQSTALANALAYVLQHQGSFDHRSPSIRGWAQVQQPTKEQTRMAAEYVESARHE